MGGWAAVAAALAAFAAGCEQGAFRPAGGDGAPEPPAEKGRLTILLVEYVGPNASADARRIAGELMAQDLPGVFVVEGADEASVCVGRYDTWKDPKAKQMLARVRQVRDRQGRYPFAGVMLMPVPESAPPNPWPLQKAAGTYSLHVASWEAVGRKARAQDYAARLRQRGHEAYVYHGPRLSMVTLGAFGDEVFADPREVGRPGATPKIIGREVLALQKAFPTMVLEGEPTPLPTTLIRVPGRDVTAAAVGARGPLFRVTLVRWDAAAHRPRAVGVAHSRQELAMLVAGQVRQLLAGVGPDQALTIGVGAVAAEDPAARDAKAGPDIEKMVQDFLTRNRDWPNVRVVEPQQTALVLAAAGLTYADLARDPRRMAAARGLDMIIGGSVSVEGGR
jgi:hypothetical protein